ncbi:MAG: ATP-binding protein [Anaerolineae bacterium]|nr:ATP-binding protein [Anaerolineae bacterium]
MPVDQLTKDAILRVGEVSEVNGRKVLIKVDKNKNLSDVFFDGDILKNIAVNSYVEIRKGFLSIIGKVDGEKIEEEPIGYDHDGYDEVNRNRRYLTVSLSGYISQDGKFSVGTRELPLIGNEAYIVTKEQILQIHNLVGDGALFINIATSDNDDFDIAFPVDGLFNSHIAIFGNTGSGKSNTLASLYQELVKVLECRNAEQFRQKTRFLLFDFNGEYVRRDCITVKKKVYNLSTRHRRGDKLPLDKSSLLDLEMLSILSDATEKTQKPFLKRTLSFYDHVSSSEDSVTHFRNIMKKQVRHVLQMSDKRLANDLLDYMRQILPPEFDEEGEIIDIAHDLVWHNQVSEFYVCPSPGTKRFLSQEPGLIPDTAIYQRIDSVELEDNLLSRFIKFLYLQLISDVIANRAQNEHIAPAINKLLSKKSDIEKLFDTTSEIEFWEEANFVIINLNDTNLDMKKTLPLLLSKKIYSDHKREGNQKSLNIIVDEAHNILSRESFREAESWKDYRLETFEEIIKEGRKFGVFVTIASQRPNDISATIASQAHNYFIHRLINQRDLDTISSAVSYIDRITEDSIPTLPTGTCIFSGVASQRPLKINVKELADDLKPHSSTLRFEDIVPEPEDDLPF